LCDPNFEDEVGSLCPLGDDVCAASDGDMLEDVHLLGRTIRRSDNWEFAVGFFLNALRMSLSRFNDQHIVRDHG
jgi:hypothetical protein